MIPSIDERIISIIENYAGPALHENGADPTLQQLGLDSLTVIEIAMTCEEAFGIIIPDRAIGELITVGDLILLVSETYEAAIKAAI